jgi:hypothetical protein
VKKVKIKASQAKYTFPNNGNAVTTVLLYGYEGKKSNKKGAMLG